MYMCNYFEVWQHMSFECLILNTATGWLFVGFRFYSCLLEALKKDCTTSSQLPSWSSDAAEGNVTTALRSHRTDISAAAEQDWTSSPVDTLVACEQAVDSTDTVNLCDLFQ